MMNEPSGPFTIAIIVVTALFSAGGLASPPFADKYLFDPEMIVRYRQYYRLVTSGFLHANWAHLGINMFSFYSFGGYIESLIGAPTLIIIYFSSIIGGNLLSLLLHRASAYRALGASGGVCGVVFASIFLIPGTSVYVLPIPIPVPSSIFALLFIAVSFFGIRSRRGNIGHDAHLGGAIIGLVVTTLLHPRIVAESFVLWMVVMGVSLALFVYLYRSPRYRYGGLRIVRGEGDEREGWPRH
jgi:membrane associated rhomboid family serine protease